MLENIWQVFFSFRSIYKKKKNRRWQNKERMLNYCVLSTTWTCAVHVQPDSTNVLTSAAQSFFYVSKKLFCKQHVKNWIKSLLQFQWRQIEHIIDFIFIFNGFNISIYYNQNGAIFFFKKTVSKNSTYIAFKKLEKKIEEEGGKKNYNAQYNKATNKWRIKLKLYVF